MPPIQIIRQSDQTELNPQGRITSYVRIDFNVGDDGPFSISIPKESYNADEVHRRILTFAEQTIALRNKLTS